MLAARVDSDFDEERCKAADHLAFTFLTQKAVDSWRLWIATRARPKVRSAFLICERTVWFISDECGYGVVLCMRECCIDER